MRQVKNEGNLCMSYELQILGRNRKDLPVNMNRIKIKACNLKPKTQQVKKYS